MPRSSDQPTDEPNLGPLPGGRHGLSRAQVTESQRERLLASMAQLAAERGYQAATITEIARTANVSSRVFYENFESKEDCFIAAFDAAYRDFDARLTMAAATHEEWPLRVVASLRAAVEYFSAEPELTRAFVLEPPTATPRIVNHFRGSVVSGVSFLSLGRAERPGGEDLPDSTEDSILGGLLVLIGRAVFEDTAPIEAVLPDMIEFALAPYVGPEEARRLAAEAEADA